MKRLVLALLLVINVVFFFFFSPGKQTESPPSSEEKTIDNPKPMDLEQQISRDKTKNDAPSATPNPTSTPPSLQPPPNPPPALPMPLITGNAMDRDALIQIIRQPNADPQQLSWAVQRIIGLAQAAPQEKRGDAFQLLKNAAGSLAGENLQAILKVMPQFADLGGNDFLVQQYLALSDRPAEEGSTEGLRVLSYVSPEFFLSPVVTERLIDAYVRQRERPEISQVIVNTLARAGGDKGVEWLIGELYGASEQEWRSIVQSLAFSGSARAGDAMHNMLLDMTDDPQATSPAQEERKSLLRESLTRLN